MDSIYKDISERTGGDIYIGVVGPVRSGKSTFIKRFMEALVIPNISDPYAKERAKDELPQSAAGKTVMTTEPKFIPDEAVSINLDDAADIKVRLVDCVGYIVPDAMGVLEGDRPRMVRTPWKSEPVPFSEAAEMGTYKVISDHSTIGMLVTTDGSIGEIPRESYVDAEERIVSELRALGKPFAIVMNSANPSSERSIALAYELEEKYGAPVALVSCLELDAEDIRHILELVLHEFPITEVSVQLPEWTEALDSTHRIKSSVLSSVKSCLDSVGKIGEVKNAFKRLADNEYVKNVSLDSVSLGNGKASLTVNLSDGLYYSVISELTGFDIAGERELISLMSELAEMKTQYDKVSEALASANEKGYGIVMPSITDLRLEEPEIVKQSGGYGVRLRASAQSIHMIRANIETEINPIVGTQEQSADFVKYMLNEFEEDPQRIWESNMFGKSLYELVNEGLHTKLEHMPDESRTKLSETLERIINEGSSGLICILL